MTAVAEIEVEVCMLCVSVTEHGWWGVSGVTHCRTCHRTWKSSREAHCTVCHRHFSAPTNFDAHFGPAGVHRDPKQKNCEFFQREDETWAKADPRFPVGGAETAGSEPEVGPSAEDQPEAPKNEFSLSGLGWPA